VHVSIFNRDTLIGHANLSELDPPMGVATGAFVPTADYARTDHANVVDGDYVGERSQGFRVLSEAHGKIESQAIAILDWPTLGEIELHVLGITNPDYEALFGDHPTYRAYYGLDLSDEERLARDQAVRASLRARDVRAWLWPLAILALIGTVIFWIF